MPKPPKRRGTSSNGSNLPPGSNCEAKWTHAPLSQQAATAKSERCSAEFARTNEERRLVLRSYLQGNVQVREIVVWITKLRSSNMSRKYHLTALCMSLVLVTTSMAQQLRQPAASNPAARSPAPNKQQAAGGKQTAQPNNQPKAKPATEADFKMPANGSNDELVNFLADMITYLPNTPADAELYQKVAPVEMNRAAQKVLKQEKDRSSDNYKFAYKYLMAVEAMTIEKAIA